MVGHDSPEQAALTGFPEAHCRVIETKVSGDHAHVLLNAGSSSQPYLYGVNCYRQDGRWFESDSGNGPSWSPTSEDDELGMLAFWGDIHDGAEAVLVKFGDGIHEAVVHDGVYFLIWWNVPFPETFPRVISIRPRARQ
jgi:hypothetical protein